MKRLTRAALSTAVLVRISGTAIAQESPALFLARANAKVARAMAFKNQWEGPTSGPAIKKQQALIVFIAGDLRNNQSQANLVEGVKEAAAVAGWNVQVMDTYGLENRRPETFSRAMALKPAAIILAGVDAQNQQKEIKAAAAGKIPVIGWHASSRIGITDGLFTNIGTDPREAGQVAALFGIVESKAKAGVVVLADNSTAYASARTSAIVEIVKQCQTCALLGVEPTPAAANERASQFTAILQRHGTRLTHAIGANDQYFDSVAAPVSAGGDGSNRVQAIAAGDGIPSAYKRINQNSLQIGTVPEPLNMQAWQLIDEINRAISGEAPSGFAAPVYLVTNENKSFHGGTKYSFEPNNSYKEMYRKIWRKN